MTNHCFCLRHRLYLYNEMLTRRCSEIRMEIDLPSSGLAHVAYQDFFPNPPEFSRPEQPELECIWSYYLSEIAVRKIGNRIMNCFYQDDSEAWLSMPLGRMIRIAEELEIQLTQW